MDFTAEELKYCERVCDRIRERVELTKQHPATAMLVPGEDLYIWKRLDQLAAMSRDELLDEVKAEYILFAGCVFD